MIEGNRLKFGYGDIAVGARSVSQTISFQQFKPPANCGDRLDNYLDIEFLGEPIYLYLKDLDEHSQFISLLNNVADGKFVFEFKNIIFDFTKYNAESVRVCRSKANHAMDLYIMASAC